MVSEAVEQYVLSWRRGLLSTGCPLGDGAYQMLGALLEPDVFANPPSEKGLSGIGGCGVLGALLETGPVVHRVLFWGRGLLSIACSTGCFL
eukprot:6526498-Pyramimonas_sp.AAC.1